MKKLADNELVIPETGNAGEPIKNLEKDGWTSPSVNLHEGDLVYITTTPSVAVETQIARTKTIYRADAEISKWPTARNQVVRNSKRQS